MKATVWENPRFERLGSKESDSIFDKRDSTVRQPRRRANFRLLATMPTMGEIYQHRLGNGLWLVAEPIVSAQSLAMSMLLPAGVAYEPDDQQGVATLLAEMICRGAGDLDAKAHSNALEKLGVDRGAGVQTTHMHLGATMIGTKLPEALPLLIDMVRKPILPPSGLDPSRDLALQALDALEDEPQQKVFYELRQRHYPQPFGRSSLGKREHLESITLDQLRRYHQSTLVPDGSVLGFAGRFDWPQLKEQVEVLLGDWRGSVTEPTEREPAVGGYQHVKADTTQVHIGLAYDAVPEPDDESILQKAATAVLSGGMSGRLFTQVREKRGLCYAVYAAYAGQKHRGAMFSYSGTTAPRAQETLDVLAAELKRLSQGIEKDEFRRAVVGMKSRLVMQGESTGARASAITADQYMRGQPRSLDEWEAQVDAITLDRLNTFVRAYPPQEMTLVTIGPDALDTTSLTKQ